MTNPLFHSDHEHLHFSCWSSRRTNHFKVEQNKKFQNKIPLSLTDLPMRYSPRGRVPLTHSRTPALGVKGTTYFMKNNNCQPFQEFNLRVITSKVLDTTLGKQWSHFPPWKSFSDIVLRMRWTDCIAHEQWIARSIIEKKGLLQV